MPPAVYHVVTLLGALLAPLPIGTNRGLLALLWMMLSGQLLRTRGGVIPGVALLGIPAADVRRAWAALTGAWTSPRLLATWAQIVHQAGQWHPHTYAGYHPVALDVTAFWRPRLRDCPTTHYHAQAGRALPAIPLGLVARVGSVAGQRLGQPLAIVRADPADPGWMAHLRRLVGAAAPLLDPADVTVTDRGIPVSFLHAAGIPRYVARLPKKASARRATLPARAGPGRPCTKGAVVRPLARTYRGRTVPATPSDHVETWADGEQVVRAEQWTDLVRADARPGSATFTIWAIHHPRYTEPLLLATNLPLASRATAAGGQATHRGRAPVRPCAGDLPAPAGTGAAGGGGVGLCGRHHGPAAHRVLGPPSPPYPRPPAPAARSAALSAQCRPPRAHSPKSGADGPPAHRHRRPSPPTARCAPHATLSRYPSYLAETRVQSVPSNSLTVSPYPRSSTRLPDS